MTRISSTWEEYFHNRNEGLGTTYERFILHRHFGRIKNRYEVQSLLEAPSFGMTGLSGINSVWWALEGTRITLVDNRKERVEFIRNTWKELSLEAAFLCEHNDYTALSFQDNSFDMSWNFAALWAAPRLGEFLKELVRVTKNVILICVPNRLNIFNMLQSISKKDDPVFHERNMNPAVIKGIMLRLKWSVREQGFFDIPPWPDIAMNKEDLLHRMGLKGLAAWLKERDGNSICNP